MLKDYLEFINSLYPEVPDRVKRFSNNVELIHAVMGLSGECGEVMDILKKNLAYGKEFNRGEFVHEMGDVFHYFLRVATLCGVSFEEIVRGNEAKLRKRFPNGYTDYDAINKNGT